RITRRKGHQVGLEAVHARGVVRAATARAGCPATLYMPVLLLAVGVRELRGRAMLSDLTRSPMARSKSALADILCPDADSCLRSRFHRFRARPRQLPACGKARARLRRSDLVDPVIELGARPRSGGFRRAAPRAGGPAGHFFRASDA